LFSGCRVGGPVLNQRTEKTFSMMQLQLTRHPAPAQPWEAAEGNCALRAGGELRPSTSFIAEIGGSYGLDRGEARTEGSDRAGLDRTQHSAGGPGGGA
jgi:hypothetical protein